METECKNDLSEPKNTTSNHIGFSNLRTTNAKRRLSDSRSSSGSSDSLIIDQEPNSVSSSTQYLKLDPTTASTNPASTEANPGRISYLTADCHINFSGYGGTGGEKRGALSSSVPPHAYQSLKIKTKSIEKTLFPLVNQVGVPVPVPVRRLTKRGLTCFRQDIELGELPRFESVEPSS